MINIIKEKFKNRKRNKFIRELEFFCFNKYKVIYKKLKQKKFKKVKEEKFLKFINNISYLHFFILYLIGIFFFAYLYQYLSESTNIIVSTFTDSKNNIVYPSTYFDFLYFSVVTISTLGYGDFRPIGIGRIISMIQVMYGLIIFTLFVSKFASDRTSSLVKLTYTSDVERRVRKVIKRFEKMVPKLNAIHTNYSDDKVNKIVKRLSSDLNIKYAFFKHQVKVGDINDRWAEKLYLKFIKVIFLNIEAIIPILKIAYFKNYKNNKSINTKIIKDFITLSQSIKNHFKYNEITTICNNIEQLIFKYKLFEEEVNKNSWEGKYFLDIEEHLLISIKEKLPGIELPKKEVIALIKKDLPLSNKYISNIIDKINSINTDSFDIDKT